MVALVQRVSKASVTVDNEGVSEIGAGMLILLGVHQSDSETELNWLVNKCAQLRIFRDEDGRMNNSLLDTSGEVLVVSQFTLYGNTAKGNRPSYVESAPPEIAEPLYRQFIATMADRLGRNVKSGQFGAMMNVELVNDGPVTIWVEKKADTAT